MLNCIRVLGGYTDTSDVTKVFNTDKFDENAYLKTMGSRSGNAVLSLSWYVSALFRSMYQRTERRYRYNAFRVRLLAQERTASNLSTGRQLLLCWTHSRSRFSRFRCLQDQRCAPKVSIHSMRDQPLTTSQSSTCSLVTVLSFPCLDFIYPERMGCWSRARLLPFANPCQPKLYSEVSAPT